jgi:hypothetical protein
LQLVCSKLSLYSWVFLNDRNFLSGLVRQDKLLPGIAFRFGMQDGGLTDLSQFF